LPKPTDNEKRKGSGDEKSSASDNIASKNKIYGVGFAALVISVVIVVILYLAGIGTQIHIPITSVSGVSIFAIFYLMAQFDERVVEPFSNIPQLFGGHDEAKKDDKNKARAVSLWCLASGIGIILCYLTIGLLQVVGVSFALSTNGGHFWDAIISGVIIGGGTKPLHDLINLFDTSSSKAS
jgi:hypothetical protein